ncbi:MAG: peptide chain release factor N(5)-glutamine methyltransferase [Lachnospiraceae bacterium]|nr:peptide chain release factor N(5)-glutamine methyltransferase [Lachnospiraceae bacterium]
MTYLELFRLCVDKLNKVGIEEAESDSRVLFQYILNVDRSYMFMHGDELVHEDDEAKIIEAVLLREKRIPVQHITGYQNFMGFEFKVTKDVLVPRFDTECLVEETMLVCADGDKVLDVCTGSGCILISLMNYKNEIKGFGCDISDKALTIANENATELCKPGDAKPQLILSDLFENITEREFDIIVSNPPYIRSNVIKTLEPEVREYDPILALDGGEDGLIFYKRIAKDAMDYLRVGGHLLVEIGNDQGEDVRKLFVENGYSDVKIKKDLAGNDRVVSGRKVKR